MDKIRKQESVYSTFYTKPDAIKPFFDHSDRECSMASQCGLTDCLADISECPVCHEIYTDPRMLPCIHTFCRSCMQQCQRHGKITCPVCRQQYQVPSCEEFPKNFFLEKLVQAIRISKPRTTNYYNTAIMCDLCSDIEGRRSNAVAVKYCAACQQNLCDRCSKLHTKQRMSAKHSLVSLNASGLKPEEIVRMTTSYCDTHTDEILKMFCNNCKTPICVVCFATKHNGHQCEDVSSTHARFCKLLEADIQQVQTEKAMDVKHIELMQKERDQLKNTITKIRTEITQHSQSLKDRIQQETDDMLHRLADFESQQEKKFHISRENMKLNVIIKEHFARYASEMKRNGTPVDLARYSRDLHSRAAEIQKVTSQRLMQTSTAAFQPSRFQQQNMLGVVSFNENEINMTGNTIAQWSY